MKQGESVTSDRRRSRRRARCVATLCATVPALLLVPATTASPTTKFVSKRYGYSIVFPGASSRWSARFASINWRSNDIGGLDSPAMDAYSDGKTGRHYLLAARPTGSNLQRWTRFVASARSPVCETPKSGANATLAAARGRILTWSCADGFNVMVIAALHAGRGYMMLVASPTALSRTSDVRAFDAARRSFRLLHK